VPKATAKCLWVRHRKASHVVACTYRLGTSFKIKEEEEAQETKEAASYTFTVRSRFEAAEVCCVEVTVESDTHHIQGTTTHAEATHDASISTRSSVQVPNVELDLQDFAGDTPLVSGCTQPLVPGAIVSQAVL
jgi:hypothetical protein